MLKLQSIEQGNVIGLNKLNQVKRFKAPMIRLYGFELYSYEIVPSGAEFIDNSGILEFELTNVFYIGIIYDYFQSKHNKDKLKIKIFKEKETPKIINFPTESLKLINNQVISLEKKSFLIGKTVVFNKKDKITALNWNQTGQATDFIRNSEIPKIMGISIEAHELFIVAESNTEKFDTPKASFYKDNKIDLISPEDTWIGKQVKMSFYSNYTKFKLKALPIPLTLETFSAVEFSAESFPSLFDESCLKIFDRLSIKMTALSIHKIYENHNISIPQMNLTVGKVIGWAVSEHIFRFSDRKYFNYILDRFQKYSLNASGFFELDQWLISTNRSFQIFYSQLGQYSKFVQVFGEAIQSVIKKDIEKISGLQELSNLLGVCLQLYDFTETPEKIKISPNSFDFYPRPIFSIGKYFSNYFLLYNPKAMQSDGFVNGTFQSIGIEKKYPFYDIVDQTADKEINGIIGNFLRRMAILNETISAKARGGDLPSNLKLNFEDEAKNIIEYGKKSENKELIDIGHQFYAIDFSKSLFEIFPRMFSCFCGCGQAFGEFRKVFYSCNCAYDIDHNNAYASRNARCSCGMSLLQIMNFSRASNY